MMDWTVDRQFLQKIEGRVTDRGRSRTLGRQQASIPAFQRSLPNKQGALCPLRQYPNPAQKAVFLAISGKPTERSTFQGIALVTRPSF